MATPVNSNSGPTKSARSRPQHPPTSDDESCCSPKPCPSPKPDPCTSPCPVVLGILSTPTPITNVGLPDNHTGQWTAILSPTPPLFGCQGFTAGITSQGYALCYGEQTNDPCNKPTKKLETRWLSGYATLTFGPLKFTSPFERGYIEAAVTVDGVPNPATVKHPLAATRIVNTDSYILGPLTLVVPFTVYLCSGQLLIPAYRLGDASGSTIEYTTSPANFATAFTIVASS